MQPEVITRSEPEYKNLKMVAAMLEYESSNNSHYEVEDVYFDYGQDWMWTTITRSIKSGRWTRSRAPWSASGAAMPWR